MVAALFFVFCVAAFSSSYYKRTQPDYARTARALMWISGALMVIGAAAGAW